MNIFGLGAWFSLEFCIMLWLSYIQVFLSRVDSNLYLCRIILNQIFISDWFKVVRVQCGQPTL